MGQVQWPVPGHVVREVLEKLARRAVVPRPALEEGALEHRLPHPLYREAAADREEGPGLVEVADSLVVLDRADYQVLVVAAVAEPLLQDRRALRDPACRRLVRERISCLSRL